MHAPVEAVVARRDAGVRLGVDEQALPAQRRAEVGMIGVETFSLRSHAAPPFSDSPRRSGTRCPAAARMARFTATPASLILNPLWLSARALDTEAAAAALAVCSLTGLPA